MSASGLQQKFNQNELNVNSHYLNLLRTFDQA